jgi:hypothetical protein
MITKKILLALLIIFCGYKVKAQEAAPKLDYVKKIPEKLKLLSKNSMVYVYVKESEVGFLLNKQQNTCPEIKEIATKFHQSIKETGINPVLYSRYMELTDKDYKLKTTAAVKMANEKNVANIIHIYVTRNFVKDKIKEDWSLGVTEFNGTESFYNNGQKYYLIRESSYDELMTKFVSDISKAKLERAEMDFPKTPTIISEEPVKSKRFFTTYPENIKSAKFLQHKYEKMDVPSGGGLAGNYSKMYVNMYNKMLEPNNEQLTTILTKSGLKYELISFAETEQHLNDDNTYLILNIPTSETSSKFVEKTVSDRRSDAFAQGKKSGEIGASGLKSETTTIVYYYTYIKNIKTNDIYFIDYWSEGDKLSELSGKDPQFRSLQLMIDHLKK